MAIATISVNDFCVNIGYDGYFGKRNLFLPLLRVISTNGRRHLARRLTSAVSTHIWQPVPRFGRVLPRC